MPWHTVRIRSDLHRILQTQAAMQSRSTAGQLDFVLSKALEQEAGGEDDAARGTASPIPGLERFEPAPPARASNERADGETGAGTVSHRPSPSSAEVQTTVDEILASCPQCAGEMHVVDISRGGQVIAQNAMGCLDCGFVREPEGT